MEARADITAFKNGLGKGLPDEVFRELARTIDMKHFPRLMRTLSARLVGDKSLKDKELIVYRMIQREQARLAIEVSVASRLEQGYTPAQRTRVLASERAEKYADDALSKLPGDTIERLIQEDDDEYADFGAPTPEGEMVASIVRGLRQAEAAGASAAEVAAAANAARLKAEATGSAPAAGGRKRRRRRTIRRKKLRKATRKTRQ